MVTTGEFRRRKCRYLFDVTHNTVNCEAGQLNLVPDVENPASPVCDSFPFHSSSSLLLRAMDPQQHVVVAGS